LSGSPAFRLAGSPGVALRRSTGVPSCTSTQGFTPPGKR
jgi:hypothetical protein